MILFLGVVYFGKAKSQPKIIVNNYEYSINNRYENKSTWRCVKYYRRGCKGRLHTYGRVVEIINNDHNHPPTTHKTGSYVKQLHTVIIKHNKKKTSTQ